jgi:hypothetical protein
MEAGRRGAIGIAAVVPRHEKSASLLAFFYG